MENKKTILLALAAGALAGVAIGYLMARHKPEEMIDDLKDTADKVKSEFEKTIESGKEFLNTLKSQA